MSVSNRASSPLLSAQSALRDCPDCVTPTRRDFLKTTAGVAALGAVGGAMLPIGLRSARAGDAAVASQPESLVSQFYKTLTDAQKAAICFPFDHPLRSKVNNNWFIVKSRMDKLLNGDQLQMVRDIFVGLHSDEYAAKVVKQVEDDNHSDGGFNHCAVAMFGQPGEKFEFVFTGRHVTRRCDGNSVEGEGFGGPIFYGHAARGFYEKADHPGNIYWYQALAANEVFKALDGRQRSVALVQNPRPEQATQTVALKRSSKDIVGIALSDLAADQKGLVRKTMQDLLAPFRKSDSDKAMAMIEAGGFENLRMAFFNGNDADGNNLDIGDDGVWDVWQIEGPNMVWYFRGEPHVHTWVHVRDPAKA